jgi:hypothetical protein
LPILESNSANYIMRQNLQFHIAESELIWSQMPNLKCIVLRIFNMSSNFSDITVPKLLRA